MSEPFRALPTSDVTRSLEELLLPRLAEVVRRRVPGHCMSVLDLGADLMVPLARGVRRQVPTANVHVLTDDLAALNDDLHISSTRLVELRNPLPDGALRPPLCVFLPANLRTSAEDSFGRATFAEFSVGDAYGHAAATVAGTHAGHVAGIRAGVVATSSGNGGGVGAMQPLRFAISCARMRTATMARRSAAPSTNWDWFRTSSCSTTRRQPTDGCVPITSASGS